MKKSVSPEIPANVKAVIENLKMANHKLKQLKGLGSYRLATKEGRMSGRIGWACRLPDHFRADIIDLSGRPAATIAGNSRRLFARIRGDQKTYTQSSAARMFKKVTGSPLRMGDITYFLSGRVPLRDYYDATIHDKPGKNKKLILKDRSGNIVEEVVFNESGYEPERVVMYDNVDQPSYEAILGALIQEGAFTHFSSIAFNAQNGNRFDVTVSRLWLDVDLPDSLFSLKPSP